MRSGRVVFAAAGLVALAACGGEAKGSGGGAAGGEAKAPAPSSSQAAAAATSAGEQGQAVFQRVCATCHQRNGQGLPGAFPPLAGSEFVNGDASKAIKIVLHGLQGPVEVRGQRYNNVMPPWKSLPDADIAAVLTYVRSNFGNTAGEVTVAQVAEVRAATSSRTTMWTVRELE